MDLWIKETNKTSQDKGMMTFTGNKIIISALGRCWLVHVYTYTNPLCSMTSIVVVITQVQQHTKTNISRNSLIIYIYIIYIQQSQWSDKTDKSSCYHFFLDNLFICQMDGVSTLSLSGHHNHCEHRTVEPAKRDYQAVGGWRQLVFYWTWR